MICLISYGGIPAPIAPYAASVDEDVVREVSQDVVEPVKTYLKDKMGEDKI